MDLISFAHQLRNTTHREGQQEKEARTKQKKKRAGSAATFCNGHPSCTRLTWSYGLSIVTVHSNHTSKLALHQEQSTTSRMA